MKKICAFLLVIILLAANAYAENAANSLQELYSQAELLMATGDYNGAAAKFDALGAYSDASQMAMYCKAIAAAESLEMYSIAIDAFSKLGDFKDSKQMATYYTARYYQANGTIADILSASDHDLETAQQALDMAMETYTSLALFKDCLARLEECKAQSELIDKELEARKKEAYNLGVEKRNQGCWDEAVQAFEKADNYSDAATQIKATRYLEGETERSLKNWDDAIRAFEEAGGYGDAAVQILETIYQRAVELSNNELYSEAIELFKSLGNYKDAVEKVIECMGQFEVRISNIEEYYEYADKSKSPIVRNESYEYNTEGFLKSVTKTKTENEKTEIEEVKSYVVDNDGKIVSCTYESNYATYLDEFDANGNVINSITTYTDSVGTRKKGDKDIVQTEYQYDEYGNMIYSKRWMPYDLNNPYFPQIFTYENTYDENGKIQKTIRVTEKTGKKWITEYYYNDYRELLETREFSEDKTIDHWFITVNKYTHTYFPKQSD